MLMRVLAVILLLSVGIAADAKSHSFVCKASRDTDNRPETDIRSFTVSIRTADDQWRAMWSISGGRGPTKAVEYGVTPAGFTTMIRPEKLIPGHVYSGHASDGRGGSSSLTFGFDKDGTMIFPDSFDD
jgi:hypothetical protein